jgi:hypothetical protein
MAVKVEAGVGVGVDCVGALDEGRSSNAGIFFQQIAGIKECSFISKGEVLNNSF